jgi:hypothetical protein
LKIGLHRYKIYVEVNGMYPLTQRDLGQMLREYVKQHPEHSDYLKNDLMLLSEDI